MKQWGAKTIEQTVNILISNDENYFSNLLKLDLESGTGLQCAYCKFRRRRNREFLRSGGSNTILLDYHLGTMTGIGSAALDERTKNGKHRYYAHGSPAPRK